MRLRLFIISITIVLMTVTFTGCMDSELKPDLQSIWGDSSSNVFAGCCAHNLYASSPGSDVLYYNGNEWKPMDTSEIEIYVAPEAIWGSSSSDVFIVSGGAHYGNMAGVSHYDGSKWTQIINKDSAINDDTAGLNDVWGSSLSDIFAVGVGGSVIHYNGKEWETMRIPTQCSLRAIWGSSSSDVFVVGWEAQNTTVSSEILHYNGSHWSSLEHYEEVKLNDVWGSSSADIFAVGDKGSVANYEGTVLHYDGDMWSSVKVQTESTLNAIWGSSSSDVFIVGDEGTIVHYDGSTWKPMASGTSHSLNDVWGSSSSDVFAVGDEGIILHYDGKEWSKTVFTIRIPYVSISR